MPTRNPSWNREELILALELYMKNPGKIGSNDSEVLLLSDSLRKMPNFSKEVRTESFRSPGSITKKCANFQFLDPNVAGGLPGHSKLDEIIWNEFNGDKQRLHKESGQLRDITSGDPEFFEELESIGFPEDEDSEASEGRLRTRLHVYRERNSAIAKKKKKEVMEKEGYLKCEVCNFDFIEDYGPHGEGYIECHHTIPVSELTTGAKTKIKDLALLCANCHRMIHRKRPWLSLAELREIIGK